MYFEEDLVDLLYSYFQNEGYHVLKHVRIPPREIDLLLLDENSLILISIEVKLYNWKKVIEQSLKNQLYTHCSFIAMPAKHANKIDENFLETNQIGLITISENNSIEVRNCASITPRINRVFKRELYKNFNTINS